MKYGQLNLGQIEALVNKVGGMHSVQCLLADEAEVVVKATAEAVSGVFHLTVDYSQTLEQMIADGNFDLKNREITSKHFPVKGEGVVQFECCYFRFDSYISSKDAVKRIETANTENPWMPAQTEHLLSNGKQFPEDQRKFKIIALGSVEKIYNCCCFLYLGMDLPDNSMDNSDLRRCLNLSSSDSCGGKERFLSVRKLSSAA